MEGLRFRLQFEDRRILSKSQRKEGLKRSWVVLKPEQETISDLASHILAAFRLEESCPRGLILSMDGFVLPPFESTSVLKEKDVVWVRRKERSSTGTARLDSGQDPGKALIEEKKHPMNKKLLLLANEEFFKENGGYESDSEEDEAEDGPSAIKEAMENAANDAGFKKRKASTKHKSPKRKKSRVANDEVSPVACKSAEIVETIESKKTAKDKEISIKESRLEKDKPSCSKERKNIASSSKNGGEGSAPLQSLPKKNGKGCADATPTPSEDKKPSRSARRKKLKRKYLNEMRKIGTKEEGQGAQSSADNDLRKKDLCTGEEKLDGHDDPLKSVEPQKQHQSDLPNAPEENKQPDNVGSKDDIIPVEIRPGHIRFEPLDEDADQPVQKSNVPVTTFQWNGVTDKKKGQKWGKEKGTARWGDNGYQKTKWTDDGYQKTKWIDNGHQNTKWTGSSNQRNSWACNGYEDMARIDDNDSQPNAWTAIQNVNHGPSQQDPAGKDTTPSDSTDFTKLSPYGPVPQEGDVVAYRVIELSSLWTPEVSPFRVGQISFCNQGLKKIRLLPVPEHPFDLEKMDKGLYGEDGSLEVDFSSLVDVRALRPEKSEAVSKSSGQVDEPAIGESNAVMSTTENKKNEVDKAPTQAENGGSNVWEDISQALNAKKEQLSREERWKQKGTTITAAAKGPPSSVYRGLRGSALGPLMALLRSQNAM